MPKRAKKRDPLKLSKRDQKIYDETMEALRRAKVIPFNSKQGRKRRKKEIERSAAKGRFGFSLPLD